MRSADDNPSPDLAFGSHGLLRKPAPLRRHAPGMSQLAVTPLSPEGRGEKFAGHAALFDCVDRAGDVFRPGAFTAGPEPYDLPLLRNHIGSPIGRVRVREDARGLWVEGFADAVRVGDGLSIGFRATRTRQGARRELLAVELVEVSLVPVPMQPGARVTRLG